MRIIIDTNILIYREDNKETTYDLQVLMRTLQKLNIQILIHPSSFVDLNNDTNEKRKSICIAKLKTYQLLDDPPKSSNDSTFNSLIGEAKNSNDTVDNEILYSLYKNAISFLITEDKGIHRKANKLNLDSRIFNIAEANIHFQQLLPNEIINAPLCFKQVPIHNLNYEDEILNTLKNDYGEIAFKKWWNKISQEGRKAWVFEIDNKIGALLIFKIEDEALETIPALPKYKRLKICTLKVTHTGYKMGERFIRLTIDFAINNNIDEIYLTYFSRDESYLIDLIKNFGFEKKAIKDNGEEYYIKNLIPKDNNSEPKEIYKTFYPSFYAGKKVNKYIIPIQPHFHLRLFPDFINRQLNLFETSPATESNAVIRKAYLCHAPIKKINEGDLILFYRSKDYSTITTLGVVEEYYAELNSVDEVITLVSKRTVYNQNEIEKMFNKRLKVILFRYLFHFNKPPNRDCLKYVPQTITQIKTDKEFQDIIQAGELDERFIVY